MFVGHRLEGIEILLMTWNRMTYKYHLPYDRNSLEWTRRSRLPCSSLPKRWRSTLKHRRPLQAPLGHWLCVRREVQILSTRHVLPSFPWTSSARPRPGQRITTRPLDLMFNRNRVTIHVACRLTRRGCFRRARCTYRLLRPRQTSPRASKARRRELRPPRIFLPLGSVAS